MKFLDEAATANAAAARLEKQGVHTIILLIHEGAFQHPTSNPDSAFGNTDPNACVGFSGEVATLAPKLSPSIGAVISGHTHVFYNCEIAGHLVTSAGSYGRGFTRIHLAIDTHTGKPVNITAHNEVATRDVAKDPQQTAIIERFRPQAAAIAERPAGSIAASFTRDHTLAGESAMGDLVADAELFALASSANGGAQIAFMNFGGLRADLIKSDSAAGPTPVRFADLYAVQPFGNTLTVRTMTGDMLKRLLEQQFAPNGESHILQSSAGFSYSYRLHAAPGQHIVAESIKLNGHPIAPTDKLRIAASDFVAAGAESMTVFREGTDILIGPVDVDALTAYVKAHSPVTPAPQDRITRLD